MLIIEPIRWRNGALSIVDQTLLPTQLEYINLETLAEVYEAIQSLRVRGAPAIGCCAAFGLLVGVRAQQPKTLADAHIALEAGAAYLNASRPTAINLAWALRRMQASVDDLDASESLDTFWARLEREALSIFEEDQALSRAIGMHGAKLIGEGDGVLTHCNAGGLATSGYGTALALMFQAHAEGRHFRVFADETRPLLQGARLTAWELQQAQIPVTLICDNTAAQVMREGRIQSVVVGADRIAANGDAANKIGTYSLAVLARAHGIPFYVAAPYSTFDLDCPHGDDIPVEQRAADEVTHGFGRAIAPEGVDVYSPAFDVTPAEYITGIVTEGGILYPPYGDRLLEAVGAGAGRQTP